MEILDINDKEDTLRFRVNSNEETLFLLLKTYLEAEATTDIVGVYKEHYLIDKTEFFFKVKKGNAKDIFLKSLKKIKKDLESKKVK